MKLKPICSHARSIFRPSRTLVGSFFRMRGLVAIVSVFAMLSTKTAISAEPTPCRVVLMGGSSVLTSYLPEESKHVKILQQALDEQYGPHRAEVLNWADNGLFIAKYLITGQYDRVRADVDGVDLFIIRFGTNDAKRMPPKEFGAHLRKLLDLLQTDYPDAKFLLEDGIYLDFPVHYTFDRNKKQAPYWDQTRQIAAERGIAMSNLFAESERVTREGQWDLRIRRQDNRKITLDNSKDAEHAGDVGWFTDIHPNPTGVRVAVAAEMAAIRKLFPNTLPTGGRKNATPPRTMQAYIDLLEFTPDRLQKPTKAANPDGLQNSVHGN